MNLEQFRNYCLSKPGATEDLPFDESTLCFKVGGKIFAIADLDNHDFVNLKCDPAKALELREEFPCMVRPGYHMNKKHWNSVSVEDNIPVERITEWVDHSYQLVMEKLTKSERELLK